MTLKSLVGELLKEKSTAERLSYSHIGDEVVNAGVFMECSFRKEGLLRIKDASADTAIYSLLKSDWMASYP